MPTQEVENYFNERLRKLGVTDDVNTITTPVYKSIEGGYEKTAETKQKRPLNPMKKAYRLTITSQMVTISRGKKATINGPKTSTAQD